MPLAALLGMLLITQPLSNKTVRKGKVARLLIPMQAVGHADQLHHHKSQQRANQVLCTKTCTEAQISTKHK
jgi:hypothetical protein